MRLFYDGSYVVAQRNIREERLAQASQGILKVKKINIKKVMDWYTCVLQFITLLTFVTRWSWAHSTFILKDKGSRFGTETRLREVYLERFLMTLVSNRQHKNQTGTKQKVPLSVGEASRYGVRQRNSNAFIPHCAQEPLNSKWNIEGQQTNSSSRGLCVECRR